jgi:hypothetical protein
VILRCFGRIGVFAKRKCRNWVEMLRAIDKVGVVGSVFCHTGINTSDIFGGIQQKVVVIEATHMLSFADSVFTGHARLHASQAI